MWKEIHIFNIFEHLAQQYFYYGIKDWTVNKRFKKWLEITEMFTDKYVKGAIYTDKIYN
jgi:hypothetical protein